MGLVEFFEAGGGGAVEFEIESGDGVEEVLLFTGADDGGGDGLFGEEPGEADGGAGCAEGSCYFGNAVGDLEVIFAAVDLLGVEVGLGAKTVFAIALEAAGEQATTEGTPGDDAEALVNTEGDHLTLFFAVGEVVMILHGDEFRAAGFVGGVLEFGQLPGVHGTGAEIECFAGADDVVEPVHDLVDWGVVVVTVDLVEIDVVGLEATETVVDGVVEVLAAETFVVEIIAHGVVEFGGDDDLVAGDAEGFDGAAEDFFTDAEGVHVGGVEEVDAEIPGFGDEGDAVGFFEDPLPPLLGTVGHHAEAEAGDFEAGGAEAGVLHLVAFEDFSEFFFFDGTLFDDAPVGFCDVDGGGTFADAVAAVEDEIKTTVHGAKYFDAGAAGGDSAHVGGSRDQWLIEEGDQGVAHGTFALAEGEAAGVAGELERDLGRSRDDDGEGAGPEAAGEDLEAFGDFA